MAGRESLTTSVKKNSPRAHQLVRAGVNLYSRKRLSGLLLSLAKNSVDLGATDWADALRHATTRV